MTSGPYYPEQWKYLWEKLPGSIEVAVEVGSYAGEWAATLLETCFVDHLTCVDPWPKQYILDIWNERMSEHLESGRVTQMKCKSSEASKKFDDNSIGLIYIDGAHREVFEDLTDWWPKIKIGGGILCHDWQLNGVRHAVRDFFGVGIVKVLKFGPKKECKSCFTIKTSKNPSEGKLP